MSRPVRTVEEAGAYHVSPVFKRLDKVAVVPREGPRGADHTRALEGWKYDRRTGRLSVKATVDNEKESVVVQGRRTIPWAWRMEGAISNVKVLIGKEVSGHGFRRELTSSAEDRE